MYDIQALARSIPIQRLDIPLFAGFTQPVYLIRLDKIQLTSSGRLTGNKVFKLLKLKTGKNLNIYIYKR